MVLMVPKAPATYAGPTEKQYDQLSIDADHSNLVKFSNQADPGYLTIWERITKLVDQAPVAIKRRFEEGMLSER